MADNTPNYNLTKPLETEKYDIKVQNGNMDKIDTAVKDLQDEVTAHKNDYATEMPLKADKEQEAWITPTLLNGWTQYDDGTLIAYRKDTVGRVWLKGTIFLGTADSVAFILPSGYRPSDARVTRLTSFTGGTSTARLGINGNTGSISIIQFNSYISLDGLSFPTT